MADAVAAEDALTDAVGAAGGRFVLHWGEMGTRWGVSRTVSQIHALLFLLGRPMHAEEIAAVLQVARSNVSTSLRETLALMDALSGWTGEMLKLETAALKKLLKLGARVQALLR